MSSFNLGVSLHARKPCFNVSRMTLIEILLAIQVI